MATSPHPAQQTTTARNVVLAVLCTLAGTALFSVNDMAIKHLSEAYALHQVIFVRSIVGLALVTALVLVSRAGLAQLRTTRPRAHLVRIGIVLVSNVTFFVGLAALPLADAIAISFASPLIVTALSVVVLGEKVGPRRWAAVAVGLIGVIVMLRPGRGVIDPAALLVLAGAFCYASGMIMARWMKGTESALTLSFFVQVGFIVFSALFGLAAGDGRFAGSENPSLAFLFRAWVWPLAADWPYFIATGLSVALGGILIAQAYRLAEAALVAPYEYVAMPMAIVWGVAMFGQWPDMAAWSGIALICGAGLYTLWRETRVRQARRA